MEAEADTGYVFDHWLFESFDAEESLTSTRYDESLIVAGYNWEVTAYFVLPEGCVLNFDVWPTPEAGVVTPSVISVVAGTTYSITDNVITFSDGQIVTATPYQDYAFSTWGDMPATGTILTDNTYTAAFVKSVINVTIEMPAGKTGCSITVDYDGDTHDVLPGETYLLQVNLGDRYTLTANDTELFPFINWVINGRNAFTTKTISTLEGGPDKVITVLFGTVGAHTLRFFKPSHGKIYYSDTHTQSTLIVFTGSSTT